MDLIPQQIAVVLFFLRCAPGALLGYAIGGVGGGIILGAISFLLSVWLTSKWEVSTWAELAKDVPMLIGLAVWGGLLLFGVVALIAGTWAA